MDSERYIVVKDGVCLAVNMSARDAMAMARERGGQAYGLSDVAEGLKELEELRGMIDHACRSFINPRPVKRDPVADMSMIMRRLEELEDRFKRLNRLAGGET